ncbi:hypothetical protein BO79DRAFT_224827 [Aspergillus costaricaensis CBS 115574]|uniref:Uncharacterized protein n=1 Tax=Aspergillus costaricaensis CBS 115574 TaxID=1448317 RepID=A0ACD1ISU0_9EURO|nr:hypothetical protein BO79DRAFT_224827 [Aspergillus costaricaensis CBS 115574]RAK93330.1 hypothetical protein BO79DRAFT_224827 [Aspergillus costaricaensis CBS 115574]
MACSLFLGWPSNRLPTWLKRNCGRTSRPLSKPPMYVDRIIPVNLPSLTKASIEAGLGDGRLSLATTANTNDPRTPWGFCLDLIPLLCMCVPGILIAPRNYDLLGLGPTPMTTFEPISNFLPQFSSLVCRRYLHPLQLSMLQTSGQASSTIYRFSWTEDSNACRDSFSNKKKRSML